MENLSNVIMKIVLQNYVNNDINWMICQSKIRDEEWMAIVRSGQSQAFFNGGSYKLIDKDEFDSMRIKRVSEQYQPLIAYLN